MTATTRFAHTLYRHPHRRTLWRTLDVRHRVGEALAGGPELLPSYENLAKGQLLPSYAHFLSVTFTVLPQTAKHTIFSLECCACRRQPSACCLLDLSHHPSCAPLIAHVQPCAAPELCRYHRDFKPLMAHTLSRELRNEAPIGGQSLRHRLDKVRQLHCPP